MLLPHFKVLYKHFEKCLYIYFEKCFFISTKCLVFHVNSSPPETREEFCKEGKTGVQGQSRSRRNLGNGGTSV